MKTHILQPGGDLVRLSYLHVSFWTQNPMFVMTSAVAWAPSSCSHGHSLHLSNFDVSLCWERMGCLLLSHHHLKLEGCRTYIQGQIYMYDNTFSRFNISRFYKCNTKLIFITWVDTLILWSCRNIILLQSRWSQMDFIGVQDLTEAADTLTQHMTHLYYQDQTYLTHMLFTSATAHVKCWRYRSTLFHKDAISKYQDPDGMEFATHQHVND